MKRAVVFKTFMERHLRRYMSMAASNLDGIIKVHADRLRLFAPEILSAVCP